MATTKSFLYKIGVRGAKNAEKQLKGVDSATKSMAKSAVKLAAAYVSIRVATLAMQKAFEFAKLSARAENVERAFINLAREAGTAATVMLKSMREATAGTISDFELMQKFNEASLLGLPLDQFDKMLVIARGAAQATGQSMQLMLTSIVTGIGRQSKLMLDNLGILISMETANRKYADALGIQASALTEVQRKQAFANEAIRIGTENLRKAGGVVDTDIDVFDRFSVAIEDLTLAVGNLVKDETVGLLAFLTKQINLTAEAFEALESPTFKINRLAKELERLEKTQALAKIGAQFTVFGLGMEGRSEEIETIKEKIKGLFEEIKAAQEAGIVPRPQVPLDFDSFVEDMPDIILGITDIDRAFVGLEETLKTLTPEQQVLIDNIGIMTDGLIQATLFGQKFGDAIVSSLKAIAAQLIKDAAIYLLMNLFTGGTASLGGFFKFAAAGVFTPPTPSDLLPSINSGGGNQGPAVINQNTFLIINDEQATELQSILNRAQFNA